MKRNFKFLLLTLFLILSVVTVGNHSTGSAKEWTKASLNKEMTRLKKELKEYKSKSNTKGTESIFGSIESVNPYIIKGFLNEYYLVENPEDLESAVIVAAGGPVKKLGEYCTVYIDGIPVTCERVRAVKNKYAKKIDSTNKKINKIKRTLGNVPELTKSKVIGSVGSGRQLKANFKYKKNVYKQKVIYSSSNPKVAKVGSDGYVDCKKVGTAVITAKGSISGKKTKCKIVVEKPSIKFEKDEYSYVYNKEEKKVIIPYDPNTINCKYKVESSDENVIKDAYDLQKDCAIKFTICGIGTSTLTITSDDGAKAEIVVQVTEPFIDLLEKDITHNASKSGDIIYVPFASMPYLKDVKIDISEPSMARFLDIESCYFDLDENDICLVDTYADGDYNKLIDEDYSRVLYDYYYFLDYEKYNNNPEDYYLNYVKLEVKKSGSFEMTITTDSGASEKVNINVIGVMETSDVEDDEEDYYNDPNFFYDSEW